MGWFPNRDFVNSIKVAFYVGATVVITVVGVIVYFLVSRG